MTNNSSRTNTSPSRQRGSDHGWLFTEDEIEVLYESAEPLEGDILLLNSTGATGIASRAFGRSRYSHVGLVIGADLYIDAVSKDGVKVRRVSTLTADYDVDRSIVVRSYDLVQRAPSIWSTALDYLERPYRLRSVFTKPGGAFDDRDPVVCSKLVAMILQDAGLTIGRSIHSLLPRHFDLKCKGGDWRRFPLRAYDIIADPRVAITGRMAQTKYWLDLVAPLQRINVAFRRMMRYR